MHAALQLPATWPRPLVEEVWADGSEFGVHVG